jgi:hypothetical protein
MRPPFSALHARHTASTIQQRSAHTLIVPSAQTQDTPRR